MEIIMAKFNAMNSVKTTIVPQERKDKLFELLGSQGVYLGIINLTQHQSTPEQEWDGVFEPQDKENVRRLLTFDTIPNKGVLYMRAVQLAEIASESGAKFAMIGGAPYLMGALENALKEKGIQPLYSFSERESIEETLPSGDVIKKSVFRHKGFIKA